MILFSLQEFFLDYTYFAAFAVLVLMGLGLPLPEEVALVLAGYLAHLGTVDPILIGITCAAGILCGDSLPYAGGRIWGEKLLKTRRVSRWITRRRLRRFNRLFLRYGAKAVFFARFFPGLRCVAYYVAGTLRMPLWRFLYLDALGILITVPISIWFGWHFGEDIEAAIAKLKQVERGILILILVPVVLFALWFWMRRRRPAATPEAASKDPDGGA